MNVLSILNLNQNELQNAVIQNLASAPANAKQGQIYFNTSDKKLYIYDNSNWVPAGITYGQVSSTNKVITGLSADGTVTTTDVGSLSILTEGEGSTSTTLSDIVSSVNTIKADANGYKNVQSNWSETDTTSDAYITNKPTIYTQSEIDAKLTTVDERINGIASAAAGSLKYEAVDAVPDLSTMSDDAFTALTNGTIYLVPKSSATDGNNIKNEYLLIKGETKATSRFELIGDTAADLTDYIKTSELATEIAKIDISDGKYDETTTIGDKIDSIEDSLSTVATSGSYNDLTDKPKSIKTISAIISAGNTSATCTISDTDYEIIGVMCVDANSEIVYIDTKFESGKVTFEIAQTYALDISCKVTYLA